MIVTVECRDTIQRYRLISHKPILSKNPRVNNNKFSSQFRIHQSLPTVWFGLVWSAYGLWIDIGPGYVEGFEKLISG